MLIYIHKDLRDFLATGGNAPLYIDVQDYPNAGRAVITLTKLVLIAFRTSVADVALAVCKMEYTKPSEETDDALRVGFDEIAELLSPLLESSHKGIMCAPGLSYNALDEINTMVNCPKSTTEWKEMVESVVKEIEQDREKMKLEMQEQAIEQHAEDIELQILYLKRQIEKDEAAKKSTSGKLQHPDGHVLSSQPSPVTKERIIDELKKKQAEIQDKMKQPPNVPKGETPPNKE